MIFSKTSGVNDSVFGKSQEPIRMMLEKMEEQFEKNSQLKNIFAVVDSDNFAEKFSSMTSMGDFEAVGENGAYPETNMQVGYEKVIEPDEWKQSFRITQTMVEDAKVKSVVRKDGGKLMQAHGRTKEKFGASILQNGVASTMTFGKKSFDITGADGQPLFSTSHPSITGEYGNQSNLYDAPFSYDNLSYVEEYMQNVRDDNGELLNLMPNTIIIPNKAPIKKLVFETLNAEYKPGTADNDGNYVAGRFNVIVWSYLNLFAMSGVTSGQYPWFLMDSQYNSLYDGLVWLNRIPLSVKSTIDDNTDANVFRARSRWGAAPNNWRTIFCGAPGLGTAI